MPSLTESQTLRIRYICQQVDDIIYKSQRGVIEGVQFDLKHKYF